METPEHRDFSLLPDVVWVNILSYLSLKDRTAVSATCHELNSAFNHPTLWYQSKLTLQAGTRSLTQKNVLISNQQLEMVKRFGKYFQNLELTFLGYVSEIPTEVCEVLDALCENCRFETLTLSVGTVMSKRDFYWERPELFQLEPILRLIEKAYRLKTLNIIAWQMHSHVNSPNVLAAVRKNDKNKFITSLNLFYKTASETQWATLNAHLPSKVDTLETVAFCKELQVFKVQSSMLSEELIQELAKPGRTQLKRLCVLVTYSNHDSRGEVPEISSNSWVALKKQCPDLVLEFTFVTRMPYVDKAALLKPEIPVVALNFMRYSQCTKEDILSFVDKHRKTLVKFTDFTQSNGLEKEIAELVHQCSKLSYFIYTGELHHSVVVELAKSRGPGWIVFQVDSQNVVTIDTPAAIDEDQVLVQNADGSYDFASRQSYQDELSHSSILEVMIQEVGLYLGKKWLPLDVKEDQRENVLAKIYGPALDA